MSRCLFLFVMMLCFFVQGFSEDVKKNVFCQNPKESSKIPFTAAEVQSIVLITGIDSRSICSFITLGSHVYSPDQLKKKLLADKGIMKQYLNAHYLFPEDKGFFERISVLLFSQEFDDAQQVLNALVLSDLLYGYSVGETLPIYMEMFLFYASANQEEKEKENMNKILPYIRYIEGQLLSKEDFTSENLQAYIGQIRDKVRMKYPKNAKPETNKKGQPIKDSPY